MQTILLEKKIVLLLFIVLSSINVASETNRWQLNGTVPFTFQRGAEDVQLVEYAPENVPTHFDSRDQWPHCHSIGEIPDQGSCGSCWAVVAAAVITDRWCIKTGQPFVFSAEDILRCCDYCVLNKTVNRCMTGGHLPAALKFWARTGVVSGGNLDTVEGCKPYSEETAQNFAPPTCNQTCTNPEYDVSYLEDKRRGAGMRIWMHDEPLEQLLIEIMHNGPVSGIIKMTRHLENNVGTEVYQSPEAEKRVFGWHSVKIIGWGVEDNVPYWLVANTWGRDWGPLNGFFKILRGHDHLGIETSVVAPDVVSSSHRIFSINVFSLMANMIFYYPIYYSIFFNLR